MTPQSLAQELQDFLAESPSALVLEEGLILFDLADARFSISAENEKCLLHLWSSERNVVRRVTDVSRKNGSLLLEVRKFGQPKPTRLEICSNRDRRTPSAKRAARASFQRIFTSMLQREYPGHTIEKLTAAADLEHSFGPAYARGIVRQGRTAFAVIGVNDQELQSTIDGLLAAGLLWLQLCRENTSKYLVEGLRVFVPAGCASTIRTRLANLNHRASRFHLFEFEQRDASVRELDIHDAGNIATRLIRCPDHAAARERFQSEIHQVLGMVQCGKDDVEVAVCSPGEIAFRWRGLEFARVCSALKPGSFQQEHEIVFGAGAYETALTAETEPFIRELLNRMMQARCPAGDRHDALWRMQPERWLESLLMRDIQVIDAAR